MNLSALVYTRVALGTSGLGSCLYALCQKTTWNIESIRNPPGLIRDRRLTSSRRKMVSVPERSNSGRVRDLDNAVRTAETMPSTPVRVMKCCMFGVNLNGTDSEDEMIGLFEDVAKRVG